MNNLALLEYAKEMYNLSNHYMYGTYGKKITDSLITSKAKQYPSYYTKARIAECYKHLGERAFDCVGLIKGYYWLDATKYDSKTDVSANGMHTKAMEKGSISTIDRDAKGLCVWMSGHVGVYDGEGYVYECTTSKSAYKIVKSKLDGRGWKDWFKCPYIDWINTSSNITPISTNKVKYIVKKDDTLSKIAKTYKTTWQKIYENNKSIIGKNPNLIKIGQELIIKK